MMMCDLTVKVTYQPEKATQLLSLPQKHFARSLRRDLDLWKLPHPPEANIGTLRKNGTVTFFWTTKRDLPLYRTVVAVLTKPEEEVSYFKKMSRIKSIVMTEALKDTEVHPPHLLRSNANWQTTSLHDKQQPVSHLRYAGDALPHKSSIQKIDAVLGALRVIGLNADMRPESDVYNEAIFKHKNTIQRIDYVLGSLKEIGLKVETAPKDEDRTVTVLERELWETRTTLDDLRTREVECGRMLRELGVKLELEDSDTRIQEAEEELVRERRRRIEAEKTLGDVKRECARPEVVPALLCAFELKDSFV